MKKNEINQKNGPNISIGGDIIINLIIVQKGNL